ncbi:hypothetical protein HZH66_011464 [Vespula vulgaris]|uniref:Uncharacterized protein n=1 Tax=Vespula vulgaris TaxID=7454 RepID=A0A834JH20_VESVU|nr:hypothetical protein HZH66_011464 [Vespula vulgaris]
MLEPIYNKKRQKRDYEDTKRKRDRERKKKKEREINKERKKDGPSSRASDDQSICTGCRLCQRTSKTILASYSLAIRVILKKYNNNNNINNNNANLIYRS